MSITPEDIKRVKGEGFLLNRGTQCFSGRIITENGTLTAGQLICLGEAAREYGSGTVAFTTRMTVEVPGIPYESIPAFQSCIAREGMVTGGTGARVRPVTSCKGTTCVFGLYDTQALARELHQRFYEGCHSLALPHKFKIAVGGCPNNCVKPDLNDLGVVGQRVPRVNLDLCRGCKVCQVETNCPIHVAKLEDGKINLHPEACNHCGRCISKCPFHALEEETVGYRIYIGGRWGKKVAHGRYLDRVFTSKEEVLNTIEKAILLFRDQGIAGERFADTIARLGFASVQAQLFSDELLENKESNLTAQKHLKGGATC